MKLLYFTTVKREYLACLIYTVMLASLLAVSEGDQTGYSIPDFSRYQPILDRMPFGALPEGFNLSGEESAANLIEAKVKAEQEALARKVKMSVINITPSGAVAIGFTDLSVNPPVNHYLKVGTTSGVWQVISADYKNGSAVVEREGISIDLSLPEPIAVVSSDDAPEQPAPREGATGTAATSRGRARLPGLRRSPSTAGGSIAGRRPAATQAANSEESDATATEPRGARSYADRLRERSTRQTQAQATAEQRMRDQFEKLARETAAKEIQRREEEAIQAAQEEAAIQQWNATQQSAPAVSEEIQVH